MSKTFFQNSTKGEPKYTAQEFTELFSYFFDDGIIYKSGYQGLSTTLAPNWTKDNITVNVGTGIAVLQGAIYMSDEIRTISLGACSTTDKREHTIVLWLKKSDMTFKITTKAKVPNTADNYTLNLAKVVIEKNATEVHIEYLAQSVRKDVTNNKWQDIAISSISNYKSFIQQYQTQLQSLSDSIENGDDVYSLGRVIASITGPGTKTFTIPSTAIKDSAVYEIYLNGRLVTSRWDVSVDVKNGKVVSSVPAGNTVDAIIYYPDKVAS